jgi:hypothetical protein
VLVGQDASWLIGGDGDLGAISQPSLQDAGDVGLAARPPSQEETVATYVVVGIGLLSARAIGEMVMWAVARDSPSPVNDHAYGDEQPEEH